MRYYFDPETPAAGRTIPLQTPTGFYRDDIGRPGLDEQQYYIATKGTAIRLECTVGLVSDARRQRILDFIAQEMREEHPAPTDAETEAAPARALAIVR